MNRKGILIISAPSHAGKSSISIQQDILWSLGRPAFGITPARPLSILSFQAENDSNSMHYATRDIINSLALSAEEIESISQLTSCISIRSCSGNQFLNRLDQELSRRKRAVDIVRLDPLLSFIGDDPANTTAVMNFMRGGLNDIIDRHNCGLICMHHTTKTQNIDLSKLNYYDYQYNMAGASELTNLARSIIGVIPGKDGKTFTFIVAKGQKKIGWDLPVKYFAHSTGKIFWEEVVPIVTPSVSPAKPQPPDADRILTLFTVVDREFKKDDLISRCAIISIGQNTARDLISTLVTTGKLIQFEKPRPGTRPEVWLKLPLPPTVPLVPSPSSPPPKPPPFDDDLPF